MGWSLKHLFVQQGRHRYNYDMQMGIGEMRTMTPKWGEITAGEIVTPIQGELISGQADTVFKGISTDTRTIVPGQLFLAIKGERFDGHDFLEKAIDKGASGLVMERRRRFKIPTMGNTAIIIVSDTLKALGDLAGWWRRMHHASVAAITGSVGKTTVKEMTATILALNHKTLKNRGNLNNLIGLPLTLLSMDEEDRRAVLEMGMNRPGEIGRLTEIADPDIGLITNVAGVHLEGLGDITGVARAKAELLEKISPKARIVINGDDRLLRQVAAPFPKRLITYGLGSGNDIQALEIRDFRESGLSFTLRYPANSMRVRINVPGAHNIYNALAASAIAISMHERPEHIVKGLESFKGIPSRFTLISLSRDITLVDDTYNANPASLQAALNTIKNLAADKKRIVVGLGEMMELGNKTVSAHLEAGDMVAKIGASHLFAMGEHAREMIRGALSGGLPQKHATEVYSHEEMAIRIRDILLDGDLILLKGSRKMRLETVTEYLKKHLSEAD